MKGGFDKGINGLYPLHRHTPFPPENRQPQVTLSWYGRKAWRFVSACGCRCTRLLSSAARLAGTGEQRRNCAERSVPNMAANASKRRRTPSTGSSCTPFAGSSAMQLQLQCQLQLIIRRFSATERRASAAASGSGSRQRRMQETGRSSTPSGWITMTRTQSSRTRTCWPPASSASCCQVRVFLCFVLPGENMISKFHKPHKPLSISHTAVYQPRSRDCFCQPFVFHWNKIRPILFG